MKRIFQYLKRTIEMGILYKKGGEEILIAFSNGDYVGAIEDKKKHFRLCL